MTKASPARRQRLHPKPADNRGREQLNQAIQAHQRGELDAAERLYRAVLQRDLAQPDALHYLGVLQHQRGHSGEAVKSIEAALAVASDYPDAHNNLGNVHKECGRLAEAEACYRRALALAPTHYNALVNLAVVLGAQDRLDEAATAYEQLLERAPDFAHGNWMAGLFLFEHPQSRDQVERAVVLFRHAVDLYGERSPSSLRNSLGVALYALDRADEAREVYREWSAREPDNPIPQHMLAASGGAQAPARADDAYVRETFDGFASSFDEQLLQYLNYHAPQVLASALQAVLPAPTAALDILDAGCGTGLCGPLLRPHARYLAGIDLSSGMLAQARQRGGYDELVEAELTGYLATQTARWDAIVSADTLVYFGDLGPVIAAACRALRSGGWLVFSLEAAEGDGYELSASGRYRHSRAYVERMLRGAGFTAIDIRADSLRKEVGKPVASWVVLARRPYVDAMS